MLANCKLCDLITHMFLLHFRAPSIVLGYKKCFEISALCQLVYKLDSLRLLVKPRDIYKVPLMEKCLLHVFLLRKFKHILNKYELC